jgi:hypothetical protein
MVQGVEAAVSQVAPERSTVGLDHGELDARPLPAEAMQQSRGEAPAGSGRQPQPYPADHDRLEIPARRGGRVGRGDGSAMATK